MLETVQVLSWVLKVDRSKTEAAYNELPPHSESCGCVYCLNFERACDAMPSTWWALFEGLGADPKKASGEVYQNYQRDDSSQSYCGIFHVCGEIISVPTVSEAFGDVLDVSFSRQAVLVPENFLQPVLQMDINTVMPWVLEFPPPESPDSA
jgi:hypothetical protein